MAAGNAGEFEDRRLNTWKEIASFFGCDERTVKRWETTRGLPVHRVPNGLRSPVFAYERELRTWLDSNASPNQSPDARVDSPAQPRFLGARSIALAFAAVAIALVGWLAFPRLVDREPGPQHAVRHQPNKEALAFYRAGLFDWQTRTPVGLRHAVDDFTQAIVRDPQYAEAYAGLAQCYELLREYTTVPPDYAFPRAKAAADRAITLDPSLADAHLALAFAEFYWFHQSNVARHEFQRAIALSPGNAIAHHWYATYLLEMGEFPQALGQIDKAADLDTASVAIRADKGLILFYAGRRGESKSLLMQLEQSQPQFASTHRYLAKVYLAEHDDSGFLRELTLADSALENDDGQATEAAGEKGLAASGHAGMLQSMRDVEEPLVRDNRGRAYDLAVIHAELGDTSGALEWLRTSLARGEPDVTGVEIEPSFQAMRKMPEFRRLAHAAGVQS
jgi:Tfp pilus assembly protein PilF